LRRYRHDQKNDRRALTRPWEGYAARFDDLFRTRARCQGFRRYLEGLLLSAERNETLTVLANTEPVVEAQRKEAQSLQWFHSSSRSSTILNGPE
jgi:hypothetical protein